MDILSLNQMFLLNETLVDELFKIFTDDFKLKNTYNDLESLKRRLNQIVAKEKDLKLTFQIRDNISSPTGKFLPDPNEIFIKFPKDHNFSAYEILTVFFHEYDHYLKEKFKPGKLNPPREDKKIEDKDPTEDEKTGTKNKDIVEYMYPPAQMSDLELFGKDTDPMLKLLVYLTQPHERAAISFTIAYDIYNENQSYLRNQIHSGPELIDQLIRAHEFFWDKVNNSNNKNEQALMKTNYKKNLTTQGSKCLFYMVVYLKELKRINNPEDIEYINYLTNQFYKTIKLIKKYYRRLFGVMKYARENSNKQPIFRV